MVPSLALPRLSLWKWDLGELPALYRNASHTTKDVRCTLSYAYGGFGTARCTVIALARNLRCSSNNMHGGSEWLGMGQTHAGGVVRCLPKAGA